MFNLRDILNKLKGRVWKSVASERVPLDPARIDELDLSKWGMGDVRPNIEDGGQLVHPSVKAWSEERE